MSRTSKKYPQIFVSSNSNASDFHIAYVFSPHTFGYLSYWGIENKGEGGAYLITTNKFQVCQLQQKGIYLYNHFVKVDKDAVVKYENIFIKYLDSINSKHFAKSII